MKLRLKPWLVLAAGVAFCGLRGEAKAKKVNFADGGIFDQIQSARR